MLCEALWGLVMLYEALGCLVILCDALWCYVRPCEALWCSVMQCDALWGLVMLCEDLWCSVMRCDTSWYSVMPCETSVMSRDVLWQGSRPHTFHAAIDYATTDKIIIGLLLVCVCCCAVWCVIDHKFHAVITLFLNCTSYKSKTLQRASTWASTQCWCRSVNDNKITCRYQKQFGNNYFCKVHSLPPLLQKPWPRPTWGIKEKLQLWPEAHKELGKELSESSVRKNSQISTALLNVRACLSFW